MAGVQGVMGVGHAWAGSCAMHGRACLCMAWALTACGLWQLGMKGAIPGGRRDEGMWVCCTRAQRCTRPAWHGGHVCSRAASALALVAQQRALGCAGALA